MLSSFLSFVHSFNSGRESCLQFLLNLRIDLAEYLAAVAADNDDDTVAAAAA